MFNTDKDYYYYVFHKRRDVQFSVIPSIMAINLDNVLRNNQLSSQ